MKDPEIGVCRVPGGEPVDTEPPPRSAPAPWQASRRRTARRLAISRSRAAAPDQRITAILLDMGGVVIPTLFESVAIPGFPAGPLADEPTYRAVERGDVPERDYWNAVARARPELDIGELWRTCSYVRHEIRTAVRLLSGRYKVVAFTNDMAHWFGESWPNDFPDLRAFHRIVEAQRLGVLKPEPEAFTLAARVIGEDPARCLFVDDLDVNLAGAEAIGMQTMPFDVRRPAAATQALLDRLGVEPDGAGRRVFRTRRAMPD